MNNLNTAVSGAAGIDKQVTSDAILTRANNQIERIVMALDRLDNAATRFGGEDAKNPSTPATPPTAPFFLSRLSRTADILEHVADTATMLASRVETAV